MKRQTSRSRTIRRHRTPKEKAEIWREHGRSGLSLLAFAHKHQLCYSTLIRWRKRIDQHAQSRGAPKVTASPKFIPIHLEPEPAPGVPYVLGLSGGRSLKIPPGFETESLRRLLTVLEGAQ